MFNGGNWISYSPQVPIGNWDPLAMPVPALTNVIIARFNSTGSTSYATINKDNMELVKIRNNYGKVASIKGTYEYCNAGGGGFETLESCVAASKALNSALNNGWDQVINNLKTSDAIIAQAIFLFCIGKSEIPAQYKSKICFAKNSISNPITPKKC